MTRSVIRMGFVFVAGTALFTLICSCAIHQIKPEGQVNACAMSLREPASDSPSFNLSLRKLLNSWNDRTCARLLISEGAVKAREGFSTAMDLAAQEQREGRIAVANLISAQAKIGAFLTAEEPARFLAQLNELIARIGHSKRILRALRKAGTEAGAFS